MMRNPNVTVRMRGVMEKCTFCVQRLETAKIDYKVANKGTHKRKLPTDSVMTACQQACPSEAIVFGDISDPESQVSKLKAEPHNYGLLTYLNTNPRVTYLARLRNPNPAMPDAAIGSDFDVPKPKHSAAHGASHGTSHEVTHGEETHAPAAVKGGH
jgi:molybdopterin-containing oxidoreductase family iron-sulfur binding subunit